MSAKTLRIRTREDGVVEVLSVAVGAVRNLPAVGVAVGPRSRVGEVSTLGTMASLELPKDAPEGRIAERAVGRSTSVGVGHGDVLFRYTTGVTEHGADARAAAGASSGALVYRAPMAGRFYRKASPDKPSLIEVGDVVEAGRALGLVEVMKTFHRVGYGGETLPPRAKITRALVEDGSDIAEGDALFELEAVSG